MDVADGLVEGGDSHAIQVFERKIGHFRCTFCFLRYYKDCYKNGHELTLIVSRV